MALSFALLLEMGDPESKWKPYWESFPEHLPNIFDFDGDYSHLEGSPWREQLEKKQEAMQHILKEIIPPILAKIKGKLGVDDVGKLNGVRYEKRRFVLCVLFPA
jgi:hypothetical protein